MNEIISELKEIVKDYFTIDSCHDIYHLQRVHNLSLNLQSLEGGDKYVIGVSSFLHDVHRIIQVQQGKYCTPKDSLPTVENILVKGNIKPEKISTILHSIEFHEEYSFSNKGKTVDDIETLILQDADNLDALGAIGVARSFSYGGLHNLPIWNPEIPFRRGYFDETANDPSTVHHFYSKLLRLGDTMNTASAKKVAESRINFMRSFLDALFSEWKGEI